jgi:hypothetical protein
MGTKRGALIQYDQYNLIKRGRDARTVCAERKGHVRKQKRQLSASQGEGT